MCDVCGCEQTSGEVVRLVPAESGLLRDNDRQAADNRRNFDRHRVLVINLMSAPGSGKTALLESTIDALKTQFRLAVIEGDLETENDAVRIRGHGVPAIQITTGSACHLDARLIDDALAELDISALDILFIENVGNLICPASFDLGHHANVTLLSVTEGSDKPAKYPVMFRVSDLLLISKADLLDVIDDFDPDLCERYFRDLANDAPLIRLSARSGLAMNDWLDWLRQTLTDHRQRLLAGQTSLPRSAVNGARG